MGKRYYWLKLKRDFFQSKEMKKLRTIAGGDTYTVIYLKMMLYSLEHDGLIEYEEIEDSMSEEIALAIDEQPDNVAVTLQYLLKKGLAQIVNENDLFMTSVPELTGSEGDAAERMRNLRDRQKFLKGETSQCDALPSQCDATVTQPLRDSYTEIEIERRDREELKTEREIESEGEIEKSKNKAAKPPKHKYGEYQHVMLTDEEHKKLSDELGDRDTTKCIRFLDEYIEEKGYKSKSHYLAIKRWVVDAVKKETNEKKAASGNQFLNLLEGGFGE